jgi:rhamnosyltransferase
MARPRASIVLVTRNGEATLPAVLDGITRQRFDGAIEIIAVDSSSTDGTPELLRQRVKCLVTIDPESFDHGLTRNLGVERAHAEAVVLLVQDAVPASDTWLQRLVTALEAEPTIAGTFARQIPRDEAGALTRHYAERWVAASAAPRTSAIESRDAFACLDPFARFDCCIFDNVCSCIRRSAWLRHPFAATPFAEDLEWARTVLLHGYKICYVPEAAVIHSHERSAAYELARTRLLHRRLYELFGMRTIPTLPHLVRAVASSAALHVSLERSPRAMALAVAWPLGQYLGGRDAAKAGSQ